MTLFTQSRLRLRVSEGGGGGASALREHGLGPRSATEAEAPAGPRSPVRPEDAPPAQSCFLGPPFTPHSGCVCRMAWAASSGPVLPHLRLNTPNPPPGQPPASPGCCWGDMTPWEPGGGGGAGPAPPRPRVDGNAPCQRPCWGGRRGPQEPGDHRRWQGPACPAVRRLLGEGLPQGEVGAGAEQQEGPTLG